MRNSSSSSKNVRVVRLRLIRRGFYAQRWTADGMRPGTAHGTEIKYHHRLGRNNAVNLIYRLCARVGRITSAIFWAGGKSTRRTLYYVSSYYVHMTTFVCLIVDLEYGESLLCPKSSSSAIPEIRVLKCKNQHPLNRTHYVQSAHTVN